MKNYGTLSLTVASPTAQTFTEPLSLEEVKQFLELPQERSPVDLLEDAMLGGFITGARVEAERLGKRALVVKQYDLALDHFYPCGSWRGGMWRGDEHRRAEIELPVPLIGVDLVQYKDSNGDTTPLVENTDYIVDTARGLVMPPYNLTWPSFTPWPSSAVLVRFRAGMTGDDPFWSNAGQRVLIGMKELISAWYTHRLPFEIGPGVANEYPYTVTALLTAGMNVRLH